MANKTNEKNEQERQDLRDKSSLATYSMDSSLSDENNETKKIIRQTINDTKAKLGERTNGKPIDYFNEINVGAAFNSIFADNANSKTSDVDADFKKYMTDNSFIDPSALLADSTRSLKFSNYRIIKEHIPECAQALKIIVDNIISPDDYTKTIFNIKYDENSDDKIKTIIGNKLDDLGEKYQIEDKADKIIEEAALLGESYTAVLSLNDDLSMMLNDSSYKNGILNESIQKKIIAADTSVVSVPILKESVSVNDNEVNALNEYFGFSGDNTLNENNAANLVANCINNNIEIGSSRELLFERAEADLDNKDIISDIPDSFYKKQKKDSGPSKTNKKEKSKENLYLNGSALRKLKPDNVVDLSIDNICYGYYYVEDIASGNIPQTGYLGPGSGRDAAGTMSVAQNNTIASTSKAAYTSSDPTAAQLGVSEEKLKLISDLFISQVSKKIDKEYIKKNKQFKDFIYDLVRQDYITKKKIKLTYFKPDEVIKFECPAVYKDITFFAKLYLAILTNNLLIKLGRAHDKRIFYVNVGPDGAYEQAIQSVIQDVKTKDYKMSQLNDFNTLLNLNPGRFDDYFMPSINGDRPVEIDTLAGMDVDMNNDFVEYLKNSMMSGMNVPRNLIDVTSEVDYARSISAMNANFVRSIVKYQKKLTPAFTRLYQILYRNEYKYVNDEENQSNAVNISAIRVEFPSPATLAMTNISDQIQAVEQNADFIASQLVPIKADGSTEDLRVRIKTEVTKDLLPGIDWEKYKKILDKVKIDMEKEKTNDKDKITVDPNATMGY